MNETALRPFLSFQFFSSRRSLSLSSLFSLSSILFVPQLTPRCCNCRRPPPPPLSLFLFPSQQQHQWKEDLQNQNIGVFEREGEIERQIRTYREKRERERERFSHIIDTEGRNGERDRKKERKTFCGKAKTIAGWQADPSSQPASFLVAQRSILSVSILPPFSSWIHLRYC